MSNKYTPEVKQNVLEFISLKSVKEAIKEFPDISSSTIYRWNKEEKLKEMQAQINASPLSHSMARLSLESSHDLYERLQELENKDLLFMPDKTYKFRLGDFDQKAIIADAKCMVKKCVHRPSGTETAIKFVNVPRVTHNDGDIAKIFKNLQTEIDSLNELRKLKEAKNVIIEFYGFAFGEDPMGRRQLMICMELLDLDLKMLYQRCHKKYGRFDELLLGHAVVSTIDALSYCRSKKIIHRDVKPVNILIKISTGEIKLCDFGLSRIIERSSMSSLTGTIGYYAPEYFAKKKFDSRVDVWSVGITALECIKGMAVLVDHQGNVPKSHEAMKECLNEFDAPEEIDFYVNKNYSLSLNIFLKACLAKKPEDRPKYADLKRYAFYKDHKPTTKNAPKFQENIISLLDSVV